MMQILYQAKVEPQDLYSQISVIGKEIKEKINIKNNKEIFIEFILYELCKNGFEHGNPHCPVEIRLYKNDIGFKVEVKDGGKGFDLEEVLSRSKEEVRQFALERGRGMGLKAIQKMLDRVSGYLEHSTQEGSTVSFYLREY